MSTQAWSNRGEWLHPENLIRIYEQGHVESRKDRLPATVMISIVLAAILYVAAINTGTLAMAFRKTVAAPHQSAQPASQPLPDPAPAAMPDDVAPPVHWYNDFYTSNPGAWKRCRYIALSDSFLSDFPTFPPEITSGGMSRARGDIEQPDSWHANLKHAWTATGTVSVRSYGVFTSRRGGDLCFAANLQPEVLNPGDRFTFNDALSLK